MWEVVWLLSMLCLLRVASCSTFSLDNYLAVLATLYAVLCCVL
jgi:hypothetical protein